MSSPLWLPYTTNTLISFKTMTISKVLCSDTKSLSTSTRWNTNITVVMDAASTRTPRRFKIQSSRNQL